ncbi:hypothetical protein [Lignipirellula cremea]|uniref:DUF4190 domain-containing protein n=1 Tax=Lignipirellula cremea TaxID=2528010 RepID=A0A518DQ43_9BACT|nr:hypothetical protein [Lignipirellula cremea]QDU93951.1 hypothetical protein Pla8534_17370 [Lignipirellula cremea]
MNTSTESTDAAFTSHEDPHPNYRPVSRLAVLSLVLAPLSALSLIGPVFWSFAILGSVVGLVAWRITTANAEMVSGKSLAAIGMCFSLLFLGGAPTEYLTHRYLLFSKASRFVDHWADLVAEGRLREAHQLIIPPKDRGTHGESLNDYYGEGRDDLKILAGGEETPLQSLTRFFDTEPAKSIAAAGKDAKWELLEHSDLLFDRVQKVDEFLLIYQITVPDQEQPIRARLLVDRQYGHGTLDQWMLARITYHTDD